MATCPNCKHQFEPSDAVGLRGEGRPGGAMLMLASPVAGTAPIWPGYERMVVTVGTVPDTAAPDTTVNPSSVRAFGHRDTGDERAD